MIIIGFRNLVEEFENTNITLPSGIKFTSDSAMFSRQSNRNLLSFKDIRYCKFLITNRQRDGDPALRILRKGIM